MIRFATFLLALIIPFNAYSIELQVPVDCVMGTDCFIQNHVDMQPGAGAKDYRCGSLTYDDNKSTDFRLKNYTKMEQGIGVLAAADGVVVGTRDDFEDINIRDINPNSISGKECGNAVVIDHGEGWRTQYCHMFKNSVYVIKGQKVKSGERLGRIGLSGETHFPHLSFYVKHHNNYIDPFNAKEYGENCQDTKPQNTLWSKKSIDSLPLVETSLLGIGFHDSKPDGEDARYGKYNKTALPTSSKMIVLWADVMGLQANDIITLEILSPEGHSIIKHQKNFIEPKAQQFYFTGKRSEEDGDWEPGIYYGKLFLTRMVNNKSSKVLNKTIELYIR